MGMIVKGKKRVVEDEVFKLNQEDLEFLINIIKNSMIPGKYLTLGNVVVQKLHNQLGMLDKAPSQIKDALVNQARKLASPEKTSLVHKDGEIWLKE